MIPSSDLLKEPPIIFLPSLAVKIGLPEAIIVQKLHFLLGLGGCGREIDGHHWIFNTLEQWQAMFPFWCEKTIHRTLRRLEEMHIVESCQPDGRMSRKKYYRLNDGIWVKMLKGTIPTPDLDKLSTSIRTNCPLPKHGDSIEERSKESKETPFASREGANDVSEESPPEFEPVWKPISATKEKQLARVKPPNEYPSEREFDEFIETSGADNIAMGKPGDLYHRLCIHKWHHWTGRKWIRVRDWKAYVLALESTIEDATESRGTFRPFR